MSATPEGKKYDVCLSFADEDDPIVREVAKALDDAGKNVFYYKQKQKDMMGGDILDILYDVYHNDSKYCVAFLSAAYKRSKYGQEELRYAQGRAFEEGRGYLILGSFDKTKFRRVMGHDHVTDLVATPVADFAADLIAKINGWAPRPRRRPWAIALTVVREFIRRNILAVVIAIIAIAITSYWFHYNVGPSDTDLRVLGSNENAIVLAISNDGPKPSTLTGFRLTFAGLPIEPAQMSLSDPATADVAPHSRAKVAITVRSLHAQCKPGESMRYIESEIEPLIPQATATLQISIQESDRLKTVRRPFPAGTLTKFIQGNVANHARPFEC